MIVSMLEERGLNVCKGGIIDGLIVLTDEKRGMFYSQIAEKNIEHKIT